jgi:hypothetical protein
MTIAELKNESAWQKFDTPERWTIETSSSSSLEKNKTCSRSRFMYSSLKLPDQDSNLDKLNQNQLYYHYTIGQSVAFQEFLKRSAKIRLTMISSKY